MEDVTNIDPSQLAYDTTFNTGLDMSYLYAKRYCIFCVDEIPKHNYYNLAKYQPLKQKHALQMTKVLRVFGTCCGADGCTRNKIFNINAGNGKRKKIRYDW